jgi:hypothetical protein
VPLGSLPDAARLSEVIEPFSQSSPPCYSGMLLLFRTEKEKMT